MSDTITLSDEFIQRLISYYRIHTAGELLLIWSGIINNFRPLHESLIDGNVKEIRAFLENVYIGGALWGTDWRQDDEMPLYQKRTNDALRNFAADVGVICEGTDNVSDDTMIKLEDAIDMKLSCPIYPNRPVITIKDRSIPCRFVTCAHVFHRLKKNIVNSPKQVLEIGAGTGYIAYLFRVYYPDVKFHIIDIPIMSVYMACVYATMLGEDGIWFHGEEPNDKSKLHIYSPNNTDDLPNESFDFVINHNAFPEFPKGVQRQYLKLIRRTLVKSGWFYSVNWEPHIDSGQYPTALACKEENFDSSSRNPFPGENANVYLEEIFTPK